MNYHRTRPNNSTPTHRLNVVTVSRHWEGSCSRTCSHFRLNPYKPTHSLCLLWGQFIDWFASRGQSRPVRCLGCLEDKSLDVQVEASPLDDGSQPHRNGK